MNVAYGGDGEVSEVFIFAVRHARLHSLAAWPVCSRQGCRRRSPPSSVRSRVPRRNPSGGIDFVEEILYIRVWEWRADMAEQQALLGVHKDSCTNGFCFEHAAEAG